LADAPQSGTMRDQFGHAENNGHTVFDKTDRQTAAWLIDGRNHLLPYYNIS
jgi:hypothetical protein